MNRGFLEPQTHPHNRGGRTVLPCLSSRSRRFQPKNRSVWRYGLDLAGLLA